MRNHSRKSYIRLHQQELHMRIQQLQHRHSAPGRKTYPVSQRYIHSLVAQFILHIGSKMANSMYHRWCSD